MYFSATARSITFLGTGPSEPITERRGKNYRLNTCSLIENEDDRYLIDIPATLEPIPDFDFLIITHTHKDAFGGFSRIADRSFVFIIPKGLSLDVKKGLWKKKVIEIDKATRVGSLSIIPFRVVHDVIYGYPTFGYCFVFTDGFKLTYASDMIAIPKAAEKYFRDADAAVVDGAGWKSNLTTHFGILPFIDLVKTKKWKIKRMYFTQVGRPVPDYDEAQAEISKRYPAARLTYDGMKVKI